MIIFLFEFYYDLIITERVRRDRTDSGDADRGSSFVSSKVSQHGRRPDLRELFELRWTRSWEEHVQRWNSETMFATGLYRSSLFRSISFFFFNFQIRHNYFIVYIRVYRLKWYNRKSISLYSIDNKNTIFYIVETCPGNITNIRNAHHIHIHSSINDRLFQLDKYNTLLVWELVF